jgi:UDP-glucose 4-epimerase
LTVLSRASIESVFISIAPYAGSVNVLVTGGSGQLSSYVFEELAGKHDAWGVDTRPAVHKSAMGKVEVADIRDTEAMRRAMKGADAVIHTAAQVSVQRSTEDPAFDADQNVMGTISVLRAARDSGVKKFIYISSAAVYGNPLYIPVDEKHPAAPLSFYGTSKLSAEAYTRAFGSSFGMKGTVVRPFNFYSSRADPSSPYSGVITKFTERAKSGEALRIEGEGDQTRDFLHASDVARMLRLILESNVDGLTLNCGSGAGTTISELAETVKRIAPGEVRIEHVAPRTADIKHSVAEVSLAEKELGFRTRVTLEDGLRTFFQ